ncbi:MAG: hypothetical protein ACE5IK_08400 [Acidobacteriota bacterium]
MLACVVLRVTTERVLEGTVLFVMDGDDTVPPLFRERAGHMRAMPITRRRMVFFMMAVLAVLLALAMLASQMS